MSDTGNATPPATGEPTPSDDKPLASEGEKALDAWKQRAKTAEAKAKESSAAATERDELRSQLEKLQEQNKSENEKATEKAIREAVEATRQELIGSVNVKLVKAEVRAVASGVLNDPEDAVRFLDLGEFTVNDDGEVDSKAVKAAIDQLVKDKPYLAGKTRPAGDVDQGARREGGEQTLEGLGRLARGYANSSPT